MLKVITAAVIGSYLASAAGAVTIVTVEAAGVQRTTVSLANSGIEEFTDLSTGYHYTNGTTFGGSPYFGSYVGNSFSFNADAYGGADGTGGYLSIGGSLTLTVTGAPVDYFGLWASALDGGNSIAFLKGGQQVDMINLVDYSLSDDYSGNPNGGDPNEKFAFFNFNVVGGYDQVVLIQNNGGGFETDNHTVGTFAAIPEPAAWAMMIAGFGMTGFAMRRNKTLLPA